MEQNRKALNEEELDNVAGGSGRWGGGMYEFYDEIKPSAATVGTYYWYLETGYCTYYHARFLGYDSNKDEFTVEIHTENEKTVAVRTKTIKANLGELYCTKTRAY